MRNQLQQPTNKYRHGPLPRNCSHYSSCPAAELTLTPPDSGASDALDLLLLRCIRATSCTHAKTAKRERITSMSATSNVLHPVPTSTIPSFDWVNIAGLQTGSGQMVAHPPLTGFGEHLAVANPVDHKPKDDPGFHPFQKPAGDHGVRTNSYPSPSLVLSMKMQWLFRTRLVTSQMFRNLQAIRWACQFTILN